MSFKQVINVHKFELIQTKLHITIQLLYVYFCRKDSNQFKVILCLELEFLDLVKTQN